MVTKRNRSSQTRRLAVPRLIIGNTLLPRTKDVTPPSRKLLPLAPRGRIVAQAGLFYPAQMARYPVNSRICSVRNKVISHSTVLFPKRNWRRLITPTRGSKVRGTAGDGHNALSLSFSGLCELRHRRIVWRA